MTNWNRGLLQKYDEPQFWSIMGQLSAETIIVDKKYYKDETKSAGDYLKLNKVWKYCLGFWDRVKPFFIKETVAPLEISCHKIDIPKTINTVLLFLDVVTAFSPVGLYRET